MDKNDDVDQSPPDEQDEDVEDEAVYWLDRLWNSHTRLLPEGAFDEPVRKISISMPKERFQHRLTTMLKRLDPELPPLTPELSDFLFDRAILAHRDINTWIAFANTIKSSEFHSTIAYLRQEITRFRAIHRSLIDPLKQLPPSWISAWRKTWIGSFNDHLVDIAQQLAFAKHQFDRYRTGIGSMGRTDIKSHVLLLAKDAIRKQIRGTAFSRNLTAILTGFACAARLLPRSTGPDCDLVNTVKMRISRAQRSKERKKVIINYLAQRINPRRTPAVEDCL